MSDEEGCSARHAVQRVIGLKLHATKLKCAIGQLIAPSVGGYVMLLR